MADMIRDDVPVVDVVIIARNAALESWWHSYDDSDRGSALVTLESVGISHLADRRFGPLSPDESHRRWSAWAN